MKPLTQNILLASLAVVSLATTGLVLARGAVKSAVQDAKNAQHDHSMAGHVMSGSAIAEPAYGLPDDFGPAPTFNLVDQNGQAVTLDSFKGKAVIAAFIFTRCQGPCPMISSNMAQLQAEIQKRPDHDKIALVSFSVDPEYDTPAVLKQYASQYGADPKVWTFLTGDRDAMRKMVVKGFRLGLEDAPDNKESPIIHSTRLVLIGPKGHNLGYYQALDQESRTELMARIGKVLGQANPTHPSGEAH